MSFFIYIWHLLLLKYTKVNITHGKQQSQQMHQNKIISTEHLMLICFFAVITCKNNWEETHTKGGGKKPTHHSPQPSTLSSARFGFDRRIDFLLGQQRVPLGYRTSGIGQHVRPVAQAHACRSVTHEGLSDGVVAAQFIVVVHRDHHLHFLNRER